ncbi:MAG: polysaccharide pyruvyl transferase family protein [Candidatus Kapaibacterium sp.]
MFKSLFKKKKRPSKDELRFFQKEEKRSLIIHHYCPHTYNSGDHFVVLSIRKHLKERIPEAVFLPKPCANNRGWGKPVRLTGPNIDFSNEYADAIVIGGSDQYNGWSLRLKEEELNELAPPFFLIGLGVSSKGLNAPPNIPKNEYLDDIKAANELAALSSVRDFVTYDFLNSLGVDKQIMTGCPATFLFKENFSYSDSSYAALTFPFPVIRDSNQGAYNELIGIINDLMKFLKSKGKEILLVCHDDRDLQPAQKLFPGERYFFSNYPQDYFEVYRHASYVIGTRLHATILATGMGVPHININLDLRGKGFSETFGMKDWNIDINDRHLKEKLHSRIELMEMGDVSLFNGLLSKREEYRAVFEKFMDNTATVIKERAKG